VFSNPFTDPDWAKNTVASIDKWVGFVRDRTTRPVITVVRGIVYGFLVATGVVIMVVLFAIGATRALQAALDTAFSRTTAVWSSYLILGSLFFLIGLLVARKQHRKSDELNS
jgi:hypothetical protein